MLTDVWHMILTDDESVPSGFGDSVKTTLPVTVARVCADNDIDFEATNSKYVWFSNTFEGEGRHILRFEGLTTPSKVFLNGLLLFECRSMFVPYSFDVGLKAKNNLLICFPPMRASSKSVTRSQGGRQRWRQRMINDASLRHSRNTLLGSMPGWCPEIKPIGPYQAITCERIQLPMLHSWSTTDQILPNKDIEVQFNIEASFDQYGYIDFNNQHMHLSKTNKVQSIGYVLGNPKLWFPHTHGEPHRYKLNIILDGQLIDLGYKSFRSITTKCMDDFSGIIINDVNIFCRGAVWSTTSIVDLSSKTENYRSILTLVRDAGMNMIRVPGTSLYEATVFYDLCEELGIMVWQDFMFANFDYPMTDDFISLVVDEATYFCKRTRNRSCIVIFCGGSEVFQQAAMVGLAPDRYKHRLFAEILPAVVREQRPDSLYIENSPSGGEWPFQTDTGVTHYYGVGAYLREFSDIRRSNVKFASECLALSNIPSLNALRTLKIPAVHHPEWKKGVPRDNNVTWDFEDVRDHYLESLFKVDANFLRRTNQKRYLELSSAVSCILVKEVFSEWRRHNSGCGGGLILNLQDLQIGAGWGLIDNNGFPKPIFHALKQISRPLQIITTNEGLNGLSITLVNETNMYLRGSLVINCIGHNNHTAANGRLPIVINPHTCQEVSSRNVIVGFFDICYAYRFGPPSHNVTIVEFISDSSDTPVLTACDFPLGYDMVQEDLGMSAAISQVSGIWTLTVRTIKFARFVHIDIPHFLAKDDWVDIPPNASFKTELICEDSSDRIPAGYVLALNQASAIAVGSE